MTRPKSVPMLPLLGRRAFLQRSGLLAAGLALPAGLLAGCGDRPSTTAPDVFDPSTPWWLQGGFAPAFEELDAEDFEVRGRLPAALDGLYLRNGSNPQKSDSPHWFFGDGMLHGVRLSRGRALWYRNRYVHTDLYVKGQSFTSGSPPIAGANQSNVSVIRHGGRILTSGEVGFPFEIDPSDLSTVRVHDFGGKLNTSFTAHPKIDPQTGFLHFFGYWFLPPYLTYHVADATGRVISSETIGVRASTMIHSFAITERDAVFWELPVVFSLEAATTGDGNPFVWDASYGGRIGVMPLGGRAADIRWVEIEPCYVFHEVNAFRDRDDVVIDVCRHPDMFNGVDLNVQSPDLRRWRVNTAGADLRFSEEIVSSRQLEFPMHDRRFTGRPYRHGWFVTNRPDPNSIDFAGIAHVDASTGELSAWDPGRAQHAAEAFFVPEGDGAGEGEGWLLSFVYDHVRRTSALVVLDALDVAAGPVAEVRIPARVPFGFHGVWVPAEEL